MDDQVHINEEAIKKTGVEIPEDLFRRFKTAATSRGIKMKDAVPQAFVMWLSHFANAEGGSLALGVSSTPTPSLGENEAHLGQTPVVHLEQFREQHARLDKILTGGQPDAVRAIESNLIAFSALTDLAVQDAQHGEVDRNRSESVPEVSAEKQIQQANDKPPGVGDLQTLGQESAGLTVDAKRSKEESERVLEEVADDSEKVPKPKPKHRSKAG